MMNRKEFKQYLQENVKDYLPESFADARITFNDVVKNNDNHMTGISIAREGEGIAPNIYIDGFYQQYQEGRNIDEIVGDIADARIEHDSQIQAEEITHNLMNYENVKDKLGICICDTEENREHLQGLVHLPSDNCLLHNSRNRQCTLCARTYGALNPEEQAVHSRWKRH